MRSSKYIQSPVRNVMDYTRRKSSPCSSLSKQENAPLPSGYEPELGMMTPEFNPEKALFKNHSQIEVDGRNWEQWHYNSIWCLVIISCTSTRGTSWSSVPITILWLFLIPFTPNSTCPPSRTVTGSKSLTVMRGMVIELHLLFCDSDHAGDRMRRRSRTGFLLLYLNSVPVAWYSKKQATIKLSIFGVEFAATTTMKQGMEALTGLH